MSSQTKILVNDMLQEIIPNYNVLDAVKQKEVQDLATQYLAGGLSEKEKEDIINQLNSYEHAARLCKFLAKRNESPVSSVSTPSASPTLIQPSMTQSFSAKQFRQEFDSNLASDLITLCYTTNKTLTSLQSNQQEMMKSLIEMQNKLIQRDEAMVEIIKNQQGLISTLQKKCQTQQDIVELITKERDLYKNGEINDNN